MRPVTFYQRDGVGSQTLAKAAGFTTGKFMLILVVLVLDLELR